MNKDLDHLRLLSMFHFLLGAFTLVSSLFSVLYIVAGVGMVLSPDFAEQTGFPKGDQARTMTLMFVVFVCVFLAIGFATAICQIFAGRFLGRQAHYVFCTAIAAIECISIPFGTILGVFTLMVLSRDSVKRLFNPGTPPPVPGRFGA